LRVHADILSQLIFRRDARLMTIGEGTSEAQCLVITRATLG